MSFTDFNEEDCGNPTGPPAEEEEREDAPLLQQPARDEAAQGGQAPRVQRSRQAQAEAPRYSDVTQRPAFRHVTWNASVVGGSLDEIPEDPRASARQSPRDSACDKEHHQQDGCAQNVDCSGHATLRNDRKYLRQTTIFPPCDFLIKEPKPSLYVGRSFGHETVTRTNSSGSSKQTMDFTDNPNERDSSNPTSTPPEEAEDEGPADSLSFTLVVIACAFIGFLILIISLSVTWNTRQNSDIRLCGLEEGLPRSCLSSQSEDQPLQVQPAQDSQVQGLPEAQGLLQAETSRDSNVTRRRRTQHVTWNASVLGGDDYCDAAAGASDDAVEYISMDQLAEHPRASATQAPPSASPCDEELYQQDECAHSGRADSGSRHATLRDADACSGAANEPDVCRRPIVVDEGDYVTLIGLPAQPEAENSANAQGPLEAASDLRDAQAQGGEFLAEQSSMSVRITREELRRLQRQQQNIEDDIEEDGEQEGHGDKEVAHLTSSEEESLDEESLGEVSDLRDARHKAGNCSLSSRRCQFG
ncbi:uncharacterized protein LOC112572995 [Pomacea canaliculata]|uniref:uncharacterized protein LOC112572995 n=1 Tax=Pomacea canaliculata TaxID=400727 RepID=UPI000D73CA78|nr:uncharacterized protein LOC112572995 [Pomacea canaliculata]